MRNRARPSELTWGYCRPGWLEEAGLKSLTSAAGDRAPLAWPQRTGIILHVTSLCRMVPLPFALDDWYPADVRAFDSARLPSTRITPLAKSRNEKKERGSSMIFISLAFFISHCAACAGDKIGSMSTIERRLFARYRESRGPRCCGPEGVWEMSLWRNKHDP